MEHPTESQQDDRPRQRINEPVNDADTAPLAIEEKDRSFRDNRIRNRRAATLGADKDRSEREGEQYLADKTVVKTGWRRTGQTSMEGPTVRFVSDKREGGLRLHDSLKSYERGVFSCEREGSSVTLKRYTRSGKARRLLLKKRTYVIFAQKGN